jgi:hypothetical protein
MLYVSTLACLGWMFLLVIRSRVNHNNLDERAKGYLIHEGSQRGNQNNPIVYLFFLQFLPPKEAVVELAMNCRGAET